MHGSAFGLFLGVALFVSPIIGAMALLITFEEYSRHLMPRRRALIASLQAAAAAVAAMLAIIGLAGLAY